MECKCGVEEKIRDRPVRPSGKEVWSCTKPEKAASDKPAPSTEDSRAKAPKSDAASAGDPGAKAPKQKADKGSPKGAKTPVVLKSVAKTSKTKDDKAKQEEGSDPGGKAPKVDSSEEDGEVLAGYFQEANKKVSL